MSRRRKKWVVVALVVLLPLSCLLGSFCACPLPPPAPLTQALAPADPPPGMAVLALPTGVIFRSAGFAYRGGSFLDRRDFAMTAVLVKHPRGDLLIDTGFGRDVDAHLQAMPWAFRLVTRYTRGQAAADQLDAAGYDRTRLRGIVLTHAHWDHVSGIPDFPGTPVLVTAKERRFIAEGGALTAVARSFESVRYEEYAFEGGPYLGFEESHDVYGDGAIVIVPAPGHTPGSVIVFVALPSGKRYAFVGDLAWQREGITLREERPWLQRTLGDEDPSGVREQLLRMAAISVRFPEITLVPAHDERGFAELPRL
jgi:N-acyl homoserine lactone hydrolase